MNKLIVTVLIALPSFASAQDAGNLDLGSLDAAKLQAMMQQAQIVQACMAKVDQTRLQNLQEAAQRKGTEIDQLCKEGNLAEAQAEAVAYGQQMLKEPLVKEMQDCIGIADLTLPLALWSQVGSDAQSDSHVCKLREQVVNGAGAVGAQ